MGSCWPRMELLGTFVWGAPQINRSTGRLAERAEAALLRAVLSAHTTAASHTMRTTREARVVGQPERPGAAKVARERSFEVSWCPRAFVLLAPSQTPIKFDSLSYRVKLAKPRGLVVRARNPSKNPPDKCRPRARIHPDSSFKGLFCTRIPMVELVGANEGRFHDV